MFQALVELLEVEGPAPLAEMAGVWVQLSFFVSFSSWRFVLLFSSHLS